MIDVQIFFDQPVKNNLETYDNIQKIAVDQGDHYTSDCLLRYSYFSSYNIMIAIDLKEQQTLDADSKLIIQEI